MSYRTPWHSDILFFGKKNTAGNLGEGKCFFPFMKVSVSGDLRQFSEIRPPASVVSDPGSGSVRD